MNTKPIHPNALNFRPAKGSAHHKGIIRSETEQRELEVKERELKNCSVIGRACDAFFDRRGITYDEEAPPRWSEELIVSCFPPDPVLEECFGKYGIAA